MNMSSSNTGNAEGKSVSSRKLGQEKVFIIESDMDDDMQFAAIEIASKDYPRSNSSNHEMAQKLKDTFESKLVKGLYFIGEVVDVDGECGGYNITFATLSGIKCGKSL